MKLITEYTTKARWSLHTRDNVPVLGYYTREGPAYNWQDKRATTSLGAGVNVLYQGILFPSGSGRGRSSVSFYFDDEGENCWHTSTKGTSLLFDRIIDKDIEIEQVGAISGFYGYWTTAKQGTEVTVVPVAKETAKSIISTKKG